MSDEVSSFMFWEDAVCDISEPYEKTHLFLSIIVISNSNNIGVYIEKM